MTIVWTRFATLYALTAVVSIVLGLWLGWTVGLGVAVLLLTAHAIFTIFHVYRLTHLLRAPAYGEVPNAPGVWGEIYYQLQKLAKHWHLQVRQAEQQHSRFIQAIQASPNGIVMLDEKDQIEWCNAIVGTHAGLDAKRDVGQPITHLMRFPEFVRYMNAHDFSEMLVLRGMGSSRQKVVSMQVFPYGDNRKLMLTQDITELERTDAMRRDFVANVSHELKTPLTVLSGFLETLRELPVSEEERARYLDMMEQQAARMRTIVTDLLALAKLEGDRAPSNDEVINMGDLLGHLEEDARTLSNGRHTIHFDCDANLTLVGSSSEIMSAFGNLVTNAIRYTPDGGRIDVGWRREGMQAAFVVRDSGVGIPAEELPRLTERFYRVDRSRSRDTGGTGLGLAIVKHVLQRHDAQLLIQSEEGRGSTFTARFPVQRVVNLHDAH